MIKKAGDPPVVITKLPVDTGGPIARGDKAGGPAGADSGAPIALKKTVVDDVVKGGQATESSAITAPGLKRPPSSSVIEQPALAGEAKFDVTVVGSGPGGGMCFSALVKTGVHTQLIEAGGGTRSPLSEALANHARASEDPTISQHGPLGIGRNVDHVTPGALGKDGKPALALSDPKLNAKNGKIFEPGAEVLGGCAEMNAGIWYHVDDSDLRLIAKETGDNSWLPENFQKHMQAVEDAQYQPLLRLFHKAGEKLHIDWLKNMGGLGFAEDGVKINRPFDAVTVKALAKDPALMKIVFESFRMVFGEASWKQKAIGLLTFFDPNHQWANAMDGVILTPLTVDKEGRRSNVSNVIRATAADHPDLGNVKTSTEVHSLVLGANNAVVGIKYKNSDGSFTEEPVNKLVLACGSTRTAAVLQRSGIGDPAELAKLGIECKVPLPGVGHGLKGRYEVGISFLLKDEINLEKKFQKLETTDPLYQAWKESGKGPVASNGSVFMERKGDVVNFIVLGDFEGYEYDRRVDVNASSAQQIMKGAPGIDAKLADAIVAARKAGPFSSVDDLAARVPGAGALVKDGVGSFLAVGKLPVNPTAAGYAEKALAVPRMCTIVSLDKNTLKAGQEDQLQDGTVSLDPNNIDGPPLINRKFHNDGKAGASQDEIMSVKRAREFASHYGDIIAKEVWPGSDVVSDEAIGTACQKIDWDHHPQGTTRMGLKSDPLAVCDGKCQVFGVPNLFIGDAGIPPGKVNVGPFPQAMLHALGHKLGSEIGQGVMADEAQAGRFSPLSLQLNKDVSTSNTLSDNFRIALHCRKMLDNDGIISGEGLAALIKATAAHGFSKQELADALQIQHDLESRGDKNAPIAAQLARTIASGRADQGWLADTRAAIDDVRRKNSLPSTAWKDVADSPEKIAGWKKQIGEMQQLFVDKGKLTEIGRGFHEKQLWGGMAKVTVRDDVPEFLRVGPFKDAGKVESAVVRFSNGQGCPFMDKAPDVRGAALKMFTDDGKPWDILMTNQHASHARNAEQFMKFADFSAVSQAEGQLAGVGEATKKILQGVFDPKEAARIAAQLGKDTVLHQVQSLSTETFHGGTFQTPEGLLCKCVLTPVSSGARAPVDKNDPDWLSKELDAQLAGGAVKYTLGIQVYTGDGKTPDPSDASQVWDSPVYAVADVELPAGKPPRELSDAVDKMAFNPANGFDPAEMTHAREEIYAQSAENRHAMSQEQALAVFKRYAGAGVAP